MMAGGGIRLGLALAPMAVVLIAAQPVPEQAPEHVEPYQVGPEQMEPEQVDDDAPVPQAIVRGKFVKAGEALWQVEIYTTIPLSAKALEADRRLAENNPRKRFYEDMQPWERDHVCGAVLIAVSWALSAAHCFVDSKDEMKPLGSRRARLGDYFMPDASEMAIERVILHGDYRRAGDKRHDIALIRLVTDAATDAATASNARPVAWKMGDARPLADGERLQVSGWGVTGEREAGPGNRDVDGRVLRASAQLMYADLTLVPMARCQAIPSYSKTIGDADKPFNGVLCVAGDESQQDSCQGDSGGPLTRGGLKSGLLVGLVSTGYGCGLKGVPALYTRVSSYEDWIAAAMKKSKPGVATRCVLKRWLFGMRLVCDD